jgi:hypothetical protein
MSLMRFPASSSSRISPMSFSGSPFPSFPDSCAEVPGRELFAQIPVLQAYRMLSYQNPTSFSASRIIRCRAMVSEGGGGGRGVDSTWRMVQVHASPGSVVSGFEGVGACSYRRGVGGVEGGVR